MSGFPELQDIRPLDAGFTCIHPCKIAKDEDVQRRCRRTVNRDDRNLAEKLRSDIIRSGAQGEQIWQQLMQYAELCCCKQSHRSNALKLGRVHEVATVWFSQLVGQSQVGLITNHNPPALQRFLPYKSTTRSSSIRHSFLSPLTSTDTDEGTLYMIRRREDPGFVKIGFTQKIADERYTFFQSSCGFEALPLRQFRRVPCVRRVERLVHNELKEYRRECTTCVNRKECGALHTEWFEADEEHAATVMGKWVLWMSDADPYEVGGQLKEFWKRVQLGLERSGLLPTSTNVMKAWHEQKAREDHRVVALSKLQSGRKLLQFNTGKPNI